MGPAMDDTRPIFLQIAERIEDDIIEGTLEEEAQAPSTTQIAAFYHINPATAAKGVNLLVDEGILYKKRGIGMFVATGAREIALTKRKEQFFEQYIINLVREANRLGITTEQLNDMIKKGAAQQ